MTIFDNFPKEKSGESGGKLAIASEILVKGVYSRKEGQDSRVYHVEKVVVVINKPDGLIVGG